MMVQFAGRHPPQKRCFCLWLYIQVYWDKPDISGTLNMWLLITLNHPETCPGARLHDSAGRPHEECRTTTSVQSKVMYVPHGFHSNFRCVTAKSSTKSTKRSPEITTVPGWYQGTLLALEGGCSPITQKPGNFIGSHRLRSLAWTESVELPRCGLKNPPNVRTTSGWSMSCQFTSRGGKLQPKTEAYWLYRTRWSMSCKLCQWPFHTNSCCRCYG